MNYIILNGVNSNTITGLIIQELPPISKPLMRTQIDQIDGRDGDIVTKLGYSTVDKELSIGLHGNFDIDSVIEYFASEGTVIFSNEPDKYYRYQILDQIDFERLVRFRTATVTLHCQPFKYEVNEDPIEEAGSTDTTGDIVTFETQSTDAVGVKVNVEPYQNLNGYDSPWVGGAGKNLLPITISSQTYHGITLTVNANGSVTVNGTASELTIFVLTSSLALPDGTYVINGCPSGGGSSTYRLDVNDGSIGQDTGGSATFNVSGGTGIRNVRLRIASGYTANNLVFWPMIRIAGSSNTFEPYENICPIYPANGKNLLPYPYSSGSSLTSNGITFTANADGSLSVSGTATANADFYFVGAYGQYVDAHIPSGSYILSMSRKGGTASTNVRIYFVENGSSTVYASEASPLSCSVDSTKTYLIFMRIMSGASVNEIYYPMIRPVEITDSTYVPYNAIGITRTGLNLLNNQLTNGTTAGVAYTHNADGSITCVGTATSTSSIKEITPRTLTPHKKGTYILKGSGTNIKVRANTYDANGNVVGRIPDNGSGATIVLNDTVVDFSVMAYAGATVAVNETIYPIVTYESVATSYEPYTAERYYPISDNPVYGGTLDVVSGVLTVDRGYVAFDGTGWTMYTSGKFYSATDSLPQGNSGASVANMFISNLYPFSGNGDSNSSAITTDKHFYAQKSYHRAWVYDSSFTTLESFQTELSANNLQIVYPLATPVTYQLTPVQVKTLLGYNNIWTDSGTVTVSVPNMISVVNEGNTIAKPTMTIYGSGNVGVWLNGMQVFQIALGDTGNITIDAEQMEAYQGGILRNRLVTGDYSNFVLQKGENTISVTGNVTNVEITNYSRWL